MALTYWAGNRITGLSTDSKPTNVPDGTLFNETDGDRDRFIFVGGTWHKFEVGAPPPPPPPEWQRPSDWLTMPTVTANDDTFVALHAIFDDANTGADNYCSFRFTTNAGQYEVDWGDGTVTLHDSNTNAEHQYDYTTYDPNDTTLTSRGYKQAIITVTPVSGELRTCNFQQRFVTSPVQNQAYSTGFLDCILSMPNANSGSSITFGGTTVRHSYVEQFTVLEIGACTSMSSMFVSCNSLQSVPFFDTSNVTNMAGMFSSCNSLQSVPFFDTSNVTNMNTMFNGCNSLQSVPFFDTSNVTNMSSMFNSCNSLQSVPFFDTSNVTTMSNMFFICNSLQSVPFFDTSNVTTMSNMFNSCFSLNHIPALSTNSITPTAGSDLSSFAVNCNSLNRCDMVFARTVTFQNCQLSQSELVNIFTNLVDRTSTTSANINISGNWGATALTQAERDIALDKNWTITG